MTTLQFGGQTLQLNLGENTRAAQRAASAAADSAAAALVTLADVNTAGTTQVAAVNAAGTTQVAAVNTEGTTQVAAVTDAGVTAIGAKNDILGALTRIGVSNGALTSATIGALTYTGLTLNSSTIAYGPGEHVPTRALIDSVDVDVLTSTMTAVALIYVPMFRTTASAAAYELAYVQTGIALAVGVNNVSLGGGEYPAGSIVVLRRSAGTGLWRYQETGSNHQITSPTETVGAKAAVSSVAGAALAMRVNYRVLPDSIVETLADTQDMAEGGGAVTFEQPESYGSWPTGAPNISRFDFARDAVWDGVGKLVTGIRGTLSVTAAEATAYFIVSVFERDTTHADINTAMTTATVQTRLQSRYYTLADLGLAADSVERKITIPVDPFVTVDGKSYFYSISGYKADGTAGRFGVRNVPAMFGNVARRQGWYVSTSTLTAVAAGFEPDFAVVGIEASARDTVAYEHVASANFSVSGLVLTTRIQLQRGGVISGASEARTITATAAGFVRYDTLYYDTVGLAFGLAAGTARAITSGVASDADAFIPTLSLSTYVPIANIRVTETTITVVERWSVENGIDRRLEPEINRLLASGRVCLPKTRARIASGTLRILGIGDSIFAMQNATPSSSVPNGDARDRAAAALTDANHYLRDNYATDVVDAVPLYTAVQLGRTADTAGTTHTKFGTMWSLINQIGKAKTLGTDLFYDNFAIGGHATTNLWSAGAPTALLNAITTYITANSVSLVVVNLGMNERGQTTTAANLVQIKKAIQAVGAEVILMEVSRPRATAANATPMTASDVAAWKLTNRQIRSAAQYEDVVNGIYACAVCPVGVLYDDRFIGQIGITTGDACNANRLNHPGISEEAAKGAMLVRLVCG